MMSLEQLLARSRTLAALSQPDLARLAGAFTLREYPDGHVFIREGDSGDEVFLLVGGEIQVLRRGAEMNRMRPGALFGLMALVDAGPRSATCRGDGSCQVATLSRADSEALFQRAPAIALAFQRAVAKQLAQDFRHLNELLRQHLGAAQTGAAMLKS